MSSKRPILDGMGKAESPSTGAKANPPLHDSVRPWRAPEGGERVGGYHIDALIGDGGMALVYSAKHAQLNRRVAIKILRPEFAAQAEEVERFFAEARAANEIHHPNIIEIFDLGEDSSFSPPRTYMVMELLAGQSLRERLDEGGALPAHEAVAIAQPVISALAALHRREILHRDIKPSNIFIKDEEGGAQTVKVLDLGLAKAFGSRPGSGPSSPHAISGTPEYMAPEQILGEELDQRTDIYAVGLLLHELLRGEPTFSGPSGSVMVKQLQDAAPPLRLDGSVAEPGWLANIVAQCLEKERTKRFATAEALGTALERCLHRPAGRSAELTAEIIPYPMEPRSKGLRSSAFLLLAAMALAGAAFFLLGPWSGPKAVSPKGVVSTPADAVDDAAVVEEKRTGLATVIERPDGKGGTPSDAGAQKGADAAPGAQKNSKNTAPSSKKGKERPTKRQRARKSRPKKAQPDAMKSKTKRVGEGTVDPFAQ